MNNYIEGIDVSYHQKIIDWPKVIASGIKFAFIRVSDGGFFDPKFKQNWAEAKPIVRGAYQYFRPRQNPQRQAEMMLKYAPDADLPLVLDLETLDGVDHATFIGRVDAWRDIIIEETKRKPIIYTSAGFWNRLGVGATIGGDLWVAHWTARPKPFLPFIWKDWAFWQYSDKGAVPGITEIVDLDRYHGTLEELRERYHI